MAWGVSSKLWTLTGERTFTIIQRNRMSGNCAVASQRNTDYYDMKSIPPEIQARFDDILKLRDVPLYSRPEYRKWVRYFWDFHAKYPLPGERSVQVRRFSEKIRSKGQSET